MKTIQQIIRELKEPFAADQIHWRVGATYGDDANKKGIALAYIDARHVMNRLDEVVGPENWQDRIIPSPEGFICEIGILIERNTIKHVLFENHSEEHNDISYEWVWKANNAGKTEFEAEKGGGSDAFKRAGVMWGIGRYLYDLPSEWVPVEKKGKSWVIKKGCEPKLPAGFLPTSQSVQADTSLDDIRQEDVSSEGGIVTLEAIHAILDEVQKLDETQKETFKSYLRDSGFNFGKKVGDELVGWNIRYKDLEPIMRSISEIMEPL